MEWIHLTWTVTALDNTPEDDEKPMSLYEPLKDDLGYLLLHTATERFALLAEQATAAEWSHVDI